MDKEILASELANLGWELSSFRHERIERIGQDELRIVHGLFTATKVTDSGAFAHQGGDTPENLLERVKSWEEDQKRFAS